MSFFRSRLPASAVPAFYTPAGVRLVGRVRSLVLGECLSDGSCTPEAVNGERARHGLPLLPIAAGLAVPSGMTAAAVARARRAILPCVHRGEVLARAGCNCEVRACAVHGRCTPSAAGLGPAVCADCPDRLAPTAFAADAADVACGLVVGSYGAFPGLLRMQAELLWRTCGPAPLLIADDCSPRGLAGVLELEKEYPRLTVWLSPERAGQMAGDLAVVWKGLQWARRLGLRVLAKASQRLLITRPRWLPDAARGLLAAGLAVGSRDCIDYDASGPQRLFVRSELLLLDVDRFFDGRQLWREFSPRELGNPTELYVNGLVHRHFSGRMWEIPWLPADRHAASPDFVWHTCNGVDDYRTLGKELGVALDAGFDCRGWPQREGDAYRKG